MSYWFSTTIMQSTRSTQELPAHQIDVCLRALPDQANRGHWLAHRLPTMVSKFAQSAELKWRKRYGNALLGGVIQGVLFMVGTKVPR